MTNLLVQSISVTGSKKEARKKQNEDFLRVDSENGIFIPADGIGGHKSGEIASQSAVTFLYRRLLENNKMILEGSLDEKDILDSITDAFFMTNAYISLASKGPEFAKSILNGLGAVKGMLLDSENKPNNRVFGFLDELIEQVLSFEKIKRKNVFSGMGTTLDAAYIFDNNAYLGHVGNGRIYKISTDGFVSQLTHDQYGTLLLPADISNLEYTVRTMSCGLDSYVGIGQGIIIDTLKVDFLAGETIVMFTDGFTQTVSPHELAYAVGNWETCAETVLETYRNPKWMSKVYARVNNMSQTEAAKLLSEKDHATAVFIRNQG